MATPFHPEEPPQISGRKGVFCGNLSIVIPDNHSGTATTWGARVYQDGKEITHVRSITINFPLDDLINVDINLYPQF